MASWRSLLVATAALLAALLSVPVSAGLRCSIGEAACLASCVTMGQTSGHCENEECVCSGKQIDVKERVKELIGELSITDYVHKKVNEFTDVSKWQITQDIKEKIPSRCKFGSDDSFCQMSCKAIGRVSGTCTPDNADCNCSAETVTANQFALCQEDSVCTVYCQSHGSAKGECLGVGKWDCQCVSIKDGKEEFLPAKVE